MPDDKNLPVEEHEKNQQKLLTGEYHREKALARKKWLIKTGKIGEYDAPTDTYYLDGKNIEDKFAGVIEAGDLAESGQELGRIGTNAVRLKEDYEQNLSELREGDKFEESFQMDTYDYWKKKELHDLHKQSQPPPLPPTRYEDELKYMPTLMATQNVNWYGAEGWDMPVWKEEKVEERLAKFERRKRDLPDGYTLSGRQIRVVEDPKTGGMVATKVEPHGPIAELAKRAAGRVARQMTDLDASDDIYEARTKMKDSILASLNNANSLLSYNRYERYAKELQDVKDKQRQWSRDVNKHGVDYALRHWCQSMNATYRLKVVGLEEAEKHENWCHTFYQGDNVLKNYLTKDEYREEHNIIKNPRGYHGDNMILFNNLWGQDHLRIEALDFRFSLINADGLERLDGLTELKYWSFLR